ncbi:MAG: hypothetical protein QXU69_07240 [Thermofilaceae archaeon]|uniref:Uncharacterized protein n=1 Tax=Thermofilum pendens TaxID=2269 RepID=A0A7C4H7F0_THEPE
MIGGKRRLSGAAALLILLAIASFATAAITITNITEWKVMAMSPPIVKVAGADDQTNYVNVTTYTARDGTNRTVITIVGFTGDPTYYSEPLMICNKDTVAFYSVSLVYKRVLYGGWDYVKYLKFWLGSSGPLTVDSGQVSGSATTTIGPDECVAVPVEVLVKPNAPTDTVLITVEIDVVSTRQ